MRNDARASQPPRGGTQEDIVIANTRISKASAKTTRGFSLLELVITVAIVMIVAGIAIPNFMATMHSARLKGGITDFASLLQTARIRAVDDDRYYSVYVLAGAGNNPQQGYVDILPQNADGTSGTGGAAYNLGDPLVVISSEVVLKAQGAAPSTAALKALLLPATSPVVPQDESVATTAITFGPRGLPCKPLAGVCDTLGGPQAYWAFFQDSVSQNWGAVTVTPAGRIQRWLFMGGATGTWARF
jgi:prepilin-type N-terminal cleavage/methylation domain-containing protein